METPGGVSWLIIFIFFTQLDFWLCDNFSLTEESRDEIAPLDLCSLHFDLYLGLKSQAQL